MKMLKISQYFQIRYFFKNNGSQNCLKCREFSIVIDAFIRKTDAVDFFLSKSVCTESKQNSVDVS